MLVKLQFHPSVGHSPLLGGLMVVVWVPLVHLANTHCGSLGDLGSSCCWCCFDKVPVAGATPKEGAEGAVLGSVGAQVQWYL